MEKRAITQSEKAFLPSGGFDAAKLMEPRAAVALYLERVGPGVSGAETIDARSAHGRVLAQAIAADRDYPDAPRSAMDGFAVRAGARTYEVAGEVLMGRAPSAMVPHGCAVRIPTGGVVPEGCDAVVPLEDVTADGVRIALERAVAEGENVTPRASDMRCGKVVLRAGHRLRAADMAVLATLGTLAVEVHRKPLVAVLSSGDELVAPEIQPQPGEIRDSNRYAIAATLEAWGCDVVHRPTVSDEAGELERILRAQIDLCDAVVLTGGSSVGQRDETPRAVAAAGAPGVIVHGLRVKPGKPTVLAAIGKMPVIGLPGNPASALMILQAVAAPVFAALCGAAFPASQTPAYLGEELRGRPDWTWYVPVRVEDEAGRLVAHPLPLRSSAVSLIARAAGYVVMEETETFLNAGTPVLVHGFI